MCLLFLRGILLSVVSQPRVSLWCRLDNLTYPANLPICPISVQSHTHIAVRKKKQTCPHLQNMLLRLKNTLWKLYFSLWRQLTIFRHADGIAAKRVAMILNLSTLPRNQGSDDKQLCCWLPGFKVQDTRDYTISHMWNGVICNFGISGSCTQDVYWSVRSESAQSPSPKRGMPKTHIL